MRVLNLVTTEEARFFQQQVAALEARGIESTTIAVPNDHEPGDSRSVLDYARIVPETIRHSLDGYDLVHANSGLTAPAAVVQPTLPVVVSLWGSDLMGTFGPVTKRVVRHCDEVVVMGEHMTSYLDVDPAVIPHGVDLEKFEPRPRDEMRAELGWPRDRYQVLFPYGTDRPIKNYPRAERVVAEARRRLAEPIDLRSVTGVPHSEMPTYVNAADALLLTSRREGSPNSVKEAMACNVPVVATPVGDVPERVADVSPSTVADTDDELAEALASILEAGERSDGRAHAAETVSLDATSDRLYDLYRQVVDE